jgi:hypothetical protein
VQLTAFQHSNAKLAPAGVRLPNEPRRQTTPPRLWGPGARAALRRDPGLVAVERMIERVGVAGQLALVTGAGVLSSVLLYQIAHGVSGDLKVAVGVAVVSSLVFFRLFVFAPDRAAEMQTVRNRVASRTQGRRSPGPAKRGRGLKRAQDAKPGRTGKQKKSSRTSAKRRAKAKN